MSDEKSPVNEEKFQSNRKRMRAVADMLDILARFEDKNDRLALIVAIISTVDSKGEQAVDAQMREFYRTGKL